MCDNSDEVAALKNLKECCSLAGWTEAYYQKRLAGHNKEWSAKMKERCTDAAAGGSSATSGAKLKFEWEDSKCHPNPRKGFKDLKEASLAIDDLFDSNESGWQLDKPRGGVTSLCGVKHKFIRMISPADDPSGDNLRVRVLELPGGEFLYQDGIVDNGQQADDDDEEAPPPQPAKAGKSKSPEEAGGEAGGKKDKKKKKAEEEQAAAKGGRRGKAAAPEAAPPAEEDGGGDGKRQRRKAARAE